jgi:hypothetical protein
MGFFDSLMAPLGKDYCMLFYIVGIFALLLALFSFAAFVAGFFQKKSAYVMGAYFISSISYILMYYTSRLYYSICIATLR